MSETDREKEALIFLREHARRRQEETTRLLLASNEKNEEKQDASAKLALLRSRSSSLFHKGARA